MSDTGQWLQCSVPRADAEWRMVCFPHAGGSASFYRTWPQELPESVELHAVRYPGRAERFLEPLVNDAATVAEAVRSALEPLLDRPVVLFGHSMGALLAYETARAMHSAGSPPEHLVVSGTKPPHDETAVEPILDPDDDVLVANLKSLGGTETELLDDPDMRELALPYIRNDLELAERYEPSGRDRLSCPVTALAGDEDERGTPDLVRRWGELTSGSFRAHTFPGGHFYLAECPGEMLRQVLSDLAIRL